MQCSLLLQVDAEVGWCKAKMSSNGEAGPRFQARFPGVSHASVRRVACTGCAGGALHAPPPCTLFLSLASSLSSLFLSLPTFLLQTVHLTPAAQPAASFLILRDCEPREPCSALDEIMTTPGIPSIPAMPFQLPSSIPVRLPTELKVLCLSA